MKTWRENYDRPLCIFQTKEEYVLTGRRYNEKGAEFTVGDLEYADDNSTNLCATPNRSSTDHSIARGILSLGRGRGSRFLAHVHAISSSPSSQ